MYIDGLQVTRDYEVSVAQWTSAGLGAPAIVRFTGPAPITPSALTGLLASYSFESSTADSVGAYQPVTTVGTPTYVSGIAGNSAVNFNGSTYFTIPRPVTGSFSIGFWLKTTQSNCATGVWANGCGLVDGDVTGTTTDFGISLVGSKIAFGIGGDTTLTSNKSVNDGAWHHVVGTWSSTANTMYLYIDGVQDATVASSVGNRVATSNVYIGRTAVSTTGYFNGALDDLKFYEGILSAASVTTLYNSATPISAVSSLRASAAPSTGLLTLTWDDPAIGSSKISGYRIRFWQQGYGGAS
jgi:hypothetical protein